jgi:glycosyltransferase 2 family protein
MVLILTNDTTSSRRWLVWTLRIAALVVVCFGVNGTVRHALDELGKHEWHVRPAWLLVSGAAYVLAMAPLGWFWHRTLEAFGYHPPLMATMRAYYFGQLGKYVPGKAMVIILRVAAMRRWAPSMRLVIVSVFLETLTMMAVGASLAFLFSVFVLKLDAYISLIALGMAGAAGGPTLPFALRLFGRIGAGRFARDDETKPPAEDSVDVESKLRAITFGVLATGWIAAAIGWVLFATSLWGTLRAIGVDEVQLFANMPVLITAVAFAVVAGFLSMLPGGLVVRDAVLMQLLAPVCGEANALVAAVLMRLVWLVSEVLACGILYIGRGRRGQRSEVGDQGTR